jgi:hypothetical protein
LSLPADLALRGNSDSRSASKALHKSPHFPETQALSSFINFEKPAVLAGNFASDLAAGAPADESP